MRKITITVLLAGFRLCAVIALCAVTHLALAQNRIGGNLEGIADWSKSNAFADLMKQGRQFGSADSPWDGNATVDASGWPTGDFGVVLATYSNTQNVGGVYKIRFHDVVVPQLTLTASPGQIANVQLNSNGYITADLTFPEGGSQIMLSFRGTKTGVRDLTVMRPGYTSNIVFTQPFLNHVKNFDTLRFMDWAQTNGSPVVQWADRPKLSIPSYAWKGVPWEVCIQLCNQVNRNAWINVPAEANADYVQQLATLFHSKLNPNLKLYIEYSNEVWNWGFQQAQWNLAQATAAGRGSELNYDAVNNPGYWAARRIGQQIVSISEVFHTVYGTSGAAVLHPVLATQFAYPSLWLVQALDFIKAERGDPKTFLDGIAIAPYFNLGSDQTVDGLTVDQILSDLSAQVDVNDSAVYFEMSASLATFYHLNLYAYEFGSDTSGSGSIANKHLASMDPRMQAVVGKALVGWFGYGGSLMNWFTVGASDYDTNYGTWGLADDMANLPTAPKNLALLAGMTQTFPLNNGRSLPGTIDARENTSRGSNWQTTGDVQMSTTEWYGPYLDWYLLSTPVQATYSVTLNGYANSAPIRASVTIDEVYWGTCTVPVASSPTASNSLSIKLPKGYHTLQIKVLDPGTLTLHSIDIH